MAVFEEKVLQEGLEEQQLVGRSSLRQLVEEKEEEEECSGGGGSSSSLLCCCVVGGQVLQAFGWVGGQS